jgi:hypothetical protein
MIARSLIAGAALFVLMSGTSLAAEVDFTDHEGNQLTVDLDDAGKVVKATAKNKKGETLEVVQIPMKSMSMCIPWGSAGSGATLCQPLVFLTEGAFFKMGNASCWCGIIGGIPVCYGDTCH